MKKIMFNDKFGLTQAVLEGRKTQTRRTMLDLTAMTIQGRKKFLIAANYPKHEIDKHLSKFGETISPYKTGDIVAIAQSYKDCGAEAFYWKQTPGWTNKMFVKANLMPHHIKIERVRVERLQDISEEDCLKEGVCFHENPPADHKYDPYTPWPIDIKPYRYDIDNEKYFHTARFAYAYLIDKIGGNGIWAANPLVFAYDFALID